MDWQDHLTSEERERLVLAAENAIWHRKRELAERLYRAQQRCEQVTLEDLAYVRALLGERDDA